MADISKITIASGTYDIKDETARNDIADLQIPKNYFNGKKFILIGDSYADGWTPDGNVTSWESLFVTQTGLTNTIQQHYGGTGFVNMVDNKTFQTLLEEVPSSNDVTDVVVLGGWNDKSYNKTQIKNAIGTFRNKSLEKFPNANIHVGFVATQRDGTNLSTLADTCVYYIEGCADYNIHYLSNIEYSLKNYFSDLASDGIHPNLLGQQYITRNLIMALVGGSCDVIMPYTYMTFNYHSSINGNPFGSNLACYLNNNQVTITLSQYKSIGFSTPFNASSYIDVEIGTITNGYIYGLASSNNSVTVNAIIHDSNGYFPVNASINITNGKIYLRFCDINDSHNNYRSFTNISEIQLDRFCATFDSLRN